MEYDQDDEFSKWRINCSADLEADIEEVVVRHLNGNTYYKDNPDKLMEKMIKCVRVELKPIGKSYGRRLIENE
jgi:hypothetical protein